MYTLNLRIVNFQNDVKWQKFLTSKYFFGNKRCEYFIKKYKMRGAHSFFEWDKYASRVLKTPNTIFFLQLEEKFLSTKHQISFSFKAKFTLASFPKNLCFPLKLETLEKGNQYNIISKVYSSGVFSIFISLAENVFSLQIYHILNRFYVGPF